MRKTIKINGVDYTSYFTPVGYKVKPTKIRGLYSGYMLDGSSVDDVIRTKDVITATCMPLKESQVAKIMPVLCETYVEVYFYDPKIPGYRTGIFMPSDPDFQYKGTNAYGDDYWVGSAIVLTER